MNVGEENWKTWLRRAAVNILLTADVKVFYVTLNIFRIQMDGTTL